MKFQRFVTAVVLVASLGTSSAWAREVSVDTRYVRTFAVENDWPSSGFPVGKTMFNQSGPFELQWYWDHFVNPAGGTRVWLSKSSSSPDTQTFQPTRLVFYVNDRSVPVTQDWITDNFDLLSGLSDDYDVMIWVK